MGITQAECLKQLEAGDPSIVCLGGEDYPYGFAVTPFMMQPGEEKVVGQRITEVLRAARAKSNASKAPS